MRYVMHCTEARQRLTSQLHNKIAVKAVRVMLALNDSNTVISRAALQKHAWDGVPMSQAPFDKVFALANEKLVDIYGYRATPLVSKSSTTTTKKPDQYVLANVMDQSYAKFQMENQWMPKSALLFQSELNQQRHDYRNNKQVNPSLKSEEELVLDGVAIVVVSIIMVSNNHINETELFDILDKSFGINDTDTLPVVNVSRTELMKLLDRYEYVNKVETGAKDSSDKVTEYTVGRRALVELDRDSITELMKIIYGESGDDEEETQPNPFMAQVRATIEPTFGRESN